VDAFLRVGTSESVAYGTPYNSGSGIAVTIEETARLIRQLTRTNKAIEIEENRHRPEGSEVTLLLADSQKLTAATGWTSHITLEQGLEKTIAWWRRRMASGQIRPSASYAT
jgi:nucleoside-diphosphate-sugar epimerase